MEPSAPVVKTAPPLTGHVGSETTTCAPATAAPARASITLMVAGTGVKSSRVAAGAYVSVGAESQSGPESGTP